MIGEPTDVDLGTIVQGPAALRTLCSGKDLVAILVIGPNNRHDFHVNTHEVSALLSERLQAIGAVLPNSGHADTSAGHG